MSNPKREMTERWQEIVDELEEFGRAARIANDRHFAQRLRVAVGSEVGRLREALRICMHSMCDYCEMEAATHTELAEPRPCLNGCDVLLRAKNVLDETEGGDHADA